MTCFGAPGQPASGVVLPRVPRRWQIPLTLFDARLNRAARAWRIGRAVGREVLERGRVACRVALGVVCWVWGLLAVPARLRAPPSRPRSRAAPEPTVTVVTQNLYIGADLSPILA